MKNINQNTRFAEAQNTLAELTAAFNAATAEESRLLGLLAAPADTFDPWPLACACCVVSLHSATTARALIVSLPRYANVWTPCAPPLKRNGPQWLRWWPN